MGERVRSGQRGRGSEVVLGAWARERESDVGGEEEGEYVEPEFTGGSRKVRWVTGAVAWWSLVVPSRSSSRAAAAPCLIVVVRSRRPLLLRLLRCRSGGTCVRACVVWV